MFRNQPVKRKVIAAILLTSGAVLVIACGTFFTYELLTFRQMTARELSTVGQVVAANSTAALAFDNRTDATEVLSALSADRHIVAAGLYDTTGTVFARYPGAAPDDGLPAPLERDGYQFARAHVILQEPVVNANRRLGTLVLKSDLSAANEHLSLYGGLAGVAMILSCLVAFLLSNRLQRHISLPVLALANAAKAVSERKDYSVRAARFGDDELGHLTDAFNGMLAQIQGQDVEIRAMNADLETRVEERTAALAVANKELESFSYSVSHDLRAPLRSIDGFSQVLLEDCAEHLNEEGKDALQRVRKAATAMGELIDALLELSRVNRVNLRAERVDLSALVATLAAELRQSQPDRQAEFVIAPGMVVEGDRTLLRAALGNLLGNAWKYTQPRATARIEFGCLEKESETVYFVRDNGVGFDMTYVGKLFGAFQRLHRQTEFSGTGVGLATVQRIMHRHGGRAWAEGAVDQGATFYFTLHSQARSDVIGWEKAETLAGVS